MKKVGIVSCYFIRNYGSVLQSYALQQFLDNRGIPNETICVDGFLKEVQKNRLRYFAAHLLDSDLLRARIPMLLKKALCKINYKGLGVKIARRNAAIEHFAKAIRLSEYIPSLKDLHGKSKQYVAILLGSDQLWHPSNIAGLYYTLEWTAENIPAISYATSFGVNVLDRKTSRHAAAFLPRIRHISVREHSGKQIVESLTGRAPPVVLDPTLLLTKTDWDAVKCCTAAPDEPYILCCFWGGSRAHREAARRLKEKTGFRIISIPNMDRYVSCDEHYADEARYDVSPNSFISLIAGATWVCTDSFHVSVFSIIYEKDFFIFPRFAGGRQSTNSRLESLVHALGISDRLVANPESFPDALEKANYSVALEHLQALRESSRKYLIDALTGEARNN